MRKEQTLLVLVVVIGGLLIWSGTGKYTEVGAATLPPGKEVSVIAAEQPEPTKGLSATALSGRSTTKMFRPEKRAELPELPAPAALPIFYVKLITTPGALADHWRSQRVLIVPPKVVEDPNKTAATEPQDPATATPATDPQEPGVLTPGQKPFNPAKVAKLVRSGGEEVLCILEPSKEFKGQPDWVILEKWPNVSFFSSQLNPKNGSIYGRNELVGPEALQGYQTVRLAKTLLNEFHEERINRRVKDTDSAALTKFAAWVFETLPSHSGVDDVKYGLAAVKLAIEEQRKAWAIDKDLASTRQLGEYYRAAYDIDGELQLYLSYMNDGHLNDNAAQLLVGDAYERIGALDAAKALYDKAAKTGDPQARLRIGLIAEREGDLAGAQTALKGVATVAGAGASASTALARIALKQGDLAAAQTYADQAKAAGATPALNAVLGAIQYAQGKAADAEKTFAASKEDESRSEWRSNRGMALVATDKLEDAKKEFQACLDGDPLNFIDPLAGLGDVAQRTNSIQRANDYFETALARSPDNPWVLLRLAGIRLRDGQPQKALDLALHLLQVAPGCNEGLWIVGRASASLEKPDFDKSVNYLKRARDKEPDNREFIHELARVLVVSGRIDEALKVLDTATSVTSGIGRSDARLLALLAWARFLGKRPIAEVFEAIERGKRAQPDDVTKEWLNAVRKIMDDWDRTRVWEDTFDRQNSQTVGNNWTREADQALGITIGLTDGKVVFHSGQVKNAAPTREGATRLARTEDLGRLKSWEATFKASPSTEMIVHMTLGPLTDRGGAAAGGGGRRGGAGGYELGLGCDRSGSMVLWMVSGAASKTGGGPETILKDASGNPRQWPMDDFHTVRVVRTNDAKGYYEVFFDDEKIPAPDGRTFFEIGALNLQPDKKYELGFLVDADQGALVDCFVESVKVTKTK